MRSLVAQGLARKRGKLQGSAGCVEGVGGARGGSRSRDEDAPVSLLVKHQVGGVWGVGTPSQSGAGS